MLGQIQAAGVGLNMTGASVIVFAEMDWVPANILQMEDRLHRIGQEDNVLVQYLCLKDSLDANITHALNRKVKVIASAVDGEHQAEKEGAKMPRGAEAEAIGSGMTIRQKEVSHLGVFELDKEDRWSGAHKDIGRRLAKARVVTPSQYGIMLWLCYHYRERLRPDLRDQLPIAENPQLEMKL